MLHLNDQNFEPQGIHLHQANEQDGEREITFCDRGNKNRKFKVYARIDTTKAGIKVVVYAKNVLLCHTEQRISFFFDKKNVADFSNENDREFP